MMFELKKVSVYLESAGYAKERVWHPLTHRHALAVDAVHHPEGRAQVRVPGLLQLKAIVAEAAL